jgi:hypothetical protein
LEQRKGNWEAARGAGCAVTSTLSADGEDKFWLDPIELAKN